MGVSDFLQSYKKLEERNRDLEIDPALGLQAEHRMIRIEKKTKAGAITKCVTCGKKISKERLKACPETIWCRRCVEKYEKKRRKPWTIMKNYGKKL